MTLLDAPTYDPAKARTRRIFSLPASSPAWCLQACSGTSGTGRRSTASINSSPRSKPTTCRRPLGFGTTTRTGSSTPQQYTSYSYGRFEVDWGHNSDWGDIKTHKITMSKTVGSGVVVGVEVNGQKKPVFLWVQRSDKTLGFSPVQLSTTKLSTQNGQHFFQAGGIFHLCAFLAAVNLPQQPAEHLPWTDLNKGRDSFGDQQLHGFCPANRAGDLANECIAQRGAIRDQRGVHVDHDRYLCGGERYLLEDGGKAILGRLHQAAMEGCGNLQQDGPLGAAFFCQRYGPFDGRRRSRR